MIELKIKPLSINDAFQGKRFKTPKYNKFERDILLLFPKGISVKKVNLKIAIEFGYSSKLSDIDNGIKPFLDCFVKKYGVDDRNITELIVKKKIVDIGREYIKFELF